MIETNSEKIRYQMVDMDKPRGWTGEGSVGHPLWPMGGDRRENIVTEVAKLGNKYRQPINFVFQEKIFTYDPAAQVFKSEEEGQEFVKFLTESMNSDLWEQAAKRSEKKTGINRLTAIFQGLIGRNKH